jgi:hypothetical protein
MVVEYFVDLVDGVSEDDVTSAGVQHSTMQGVSQLLSRVGKERGPRSGRAMQRGGSGLPVRRIQSL